VTPLRKILNRRDVHSKDQSGSKEKALKSFGANETFAQPSRASGSLEDLRNQQNPGRKSQTSQMFHQSNHDSNDGAHLLNEAHAGTDRNAATDHTPTKDKKKADSRQGQMLSRAALQQQMINRIARSKQDS